MDDGAADGNVEAGDSSADASGVGPDNAGLVILSLPNLYSLGKATRLNNDICASVIIVEAPTAYAAVVCMVYSP